MTIVILLQFIRLTVIRRWFLSRVFRVFRDNLKLRFVELLAASASRNDLVGRPEDVDESYLCGCPGKIVDAELLHEILKSPADEHVFFGMGKRTEKWIGSDGVIRFSRFIFLPSGQTGSSKFPDPRDLRISVVEDAQCVRLRISGPKTSGDIAVVLLPTIEFSGWPKYTDILSRIPLTHPDILIHQQATTMVSAFVVSHAELNYYHYFPNSEHYLIVISGVVVHVLG